MLQGVLRARREERRRERRGERGAAAVEFALILPILATLLFGIIDYGDMLSVRQAVSQAAAEGARAAAVNPDDGAKAAAAMAAVEDALDAHGEECTAACDVEIVACGSAECAEVTVVIDYDALIPGFDLLLPETLSYTATARVS